jgi:hypothetical protein
MAGKKPSDLSKRIRIRERTDWYRPGRVKAARRKLQYRIDLFPRNVELLDNFVNARPSFEVFEHGGYRPAGAPENPCTAQPARNAFYRGTLGPVEASHPSL